MLWVLSGSASHTIQFLWRNKKNYPRIITKYSSLTSPLLLYSIAFTKLENSGQTATVFYPKYSDRLILPTVFYPKYSDRLILPGQIV